MDSGGSLIDEVKIYNVKTGDRSTIQGVGGYVGDVLCGFAPYVYQELYKISCNGLKGILPYT